MGLGKFYKSNGLMLTLQYMATRRLKKLYNWLLVKKIRGCRKIDVEPFSHIRGLSSMRIGRNFSAGPGLRLEVITAKGDNASEVKLVIGDNVVLNDAVHIGCVNRIRIGNNVLIASKVYITDHNHGYYDDRHADQHESPEIPPLQRILTTDGFVEIEDNVWIGELVSILPSSKIGRGSIIGANSVVKGEIPPYSIAVGSPAKVMKRYDVSKRVWVQVNEKASDFNIR